MSLFLLLGSCKENTIPKPRAFFRIDVPEHAYTKLESELPLTFEYADYAEATTTIEGEKKWLNVHYAAHKATLYFSYFEIQDNLSVLLEDAHEFAYQHISKATDIDEQTIVNPDKKLYGLVYNIKGSETATPVNFYLTDSTSHFIRGSLYFDMLPNNDSLAPVIRSIEADVVHMIESFEWK
jgi:gliding motility-associated lipoprotein GldD